MSWTDNSSGTESYWDSRINEGLVAGDLDVDTPEGTVNFAEVKITEGYEAGDVISLESAVTGTVEYKAVQDTISDFGTGGLLLGPSEPIEVWTQDHFILAFDHFNLANIRCIWTLPTDAFPATAGRTVNSVTWTFVVERIRYFSSEGPEIAGDNFPASVYFSSYDSGALTSQTHDSPRTQHAVAAGEDLLDGTFRYTFTGAGMVTALQAFVDDPENHSGFCTGWTTRFSSSSAWTNARLKMAHMNGSVGELTIDMDGDTYLITQGRTISTSTVASTYRTWLNSMTYSHTGGNPQTWPKTVSIEVGDFNTSTTTTLLRTMDRQSPVVSGMEATPIIYATVGETVFVSNAITISDVDSNLVEAEVRLDNFNIAEDVLELQNTELLSVSNNSEGVFVLSNADTPSNYQFALRRLTYSNRATALTTREVVILIRVKDAFGAWSNQVSRVLRLQGPEVAEAADASTAAGTEAAVADSGLSTLQIGVLVGVLVFIVVLIAVFVWRLKRKV